MQARLCTQVLVNPISMLPSTDRSIQLQIDIVRLMMKSLFGKEVEDKLLGDNFIYMNEVASILGCQPGSIGSIAMRNPLLAAKLFFGPFTSSQFRLKGPGAVREVAEKSIRDSWWGFRELFGIRLLRIGICFCSGSMLPQ